MRRSFCPHCGHKLQKLTKPSIEERTAQIVALGRLGMKIEAIALNVGRSKSTVSRVLCESGLRRR